MRLRQLFENINRTGEGKTAVVGWGRGMGHKGHMMLASSVITHAKDNEGDPYFVVSRSYGPDDPLEPEEKLAIYRKVFPEQGHIFQTATDELPDLTRVLANLNQQGYTNAIIVVGADQKAAFQYLNHYNGKPDKKGNIAFDFENLQVISRQETSDPSREEEGPRATPMRAVLMDPSKSHDEQFAVWRDAMSPEIDDEEVMALMHKAQQRMTQMAAAKKPKKKQGVAEGGRTMSRAAKGMMKYGKDGMRALAKAGRKGKDLDKIRDKYNKYDEAANPAQQAAIAIAKKKKKGVAEAIVSSGDATLELLELNIFKDLIGEHSLSNYDEEFAQSPEWQKVVARWAPKAEGLYNAVIRLHNLGKKISSQEARAVTDTAYDGNDAYNDPESAAIDLPRIYKQQYKAILQFIENISKPNMTIHEQGVAEDK
jgi:hypothetical protein